MQSLRGSGQRLYFSELNGFQNTCTTAQLVSVPPTCFQNVQVKELFDLDVDEHELDNIAFTPEAKRLVEELHRRLWRHYGCRGRACP